MAGRKPVVAHSVGIAIPAYRDALRLARCLKSIEACDPHWLLNVVVTDDSGDSSVASELRSQFPTVTWILHERNEGFASAANHAVMGNSCDYVLLLNDDCEVMIDPRAVATPLFADPLVFAVGLQSVDESGLAREGAKRVVWRFGIAKVLHNARDQHAASNGVQRTDYAVGGHAIYRRAIFKELGGFDASFHPFYWEDVDLCQRALKSGCRVLFAQDSGIVHRNDGAIRSTHQRDEIRLATWRNRLRFSFRHARGIQRALLPLAVAWLRLQARLTHDTVLLEALSATTELSKQ